MKTPSSELYDLVKSLNQSEKRYFKLYASFNKESTFYVKLFDVIKKQEEYDEGIITKLFKERKFINFSVIKSNLYDLILKSMRSYHSSSSVEYKLNEMFLNAVFLHKKGLHAQQKKILDKANKIAAHYDMSWYVVNILGKYLWLSDYPSFQKSKEEIETLYKQFLFEIEKHNELHKYILSAYQAYSLSKKHRENRGTVILNQFHPLIYNIKKIEKNPAMSYWSLYFLYATCCFYYSTCHNHTKEMKYCQKILSLIEKNQHQIKENTDLYVVALNNLNNVMIRLKKFDGILINIQKLRNIKSTSKRIASRIFFSANNLELSTYVLTKQYEKGQLLLDKIRKEQSINNIDPNAIDRKYQIAFIFHQFNIYFGLKNYSKAFKSLNLIFNVKDIETIRPDIYCISKILSVVVSYKMNDIELLENTYKSALNYLTTRRKMKKFESIFLNFVKNLFEAVLIAF